MLCSDLFRPNAARMAAGAIVISAAGFLLSCAVLTDRDWLDRHFPPDFRISYQSLELVMLGLRIAAVIAGLAILFWARSAIGHLAAGGSAKRLAGSAILAGLAAVLALGASELILRGLSWRATEEVHAASEPLRQRDARLGWTFRPSRTGYRPHGAQNIAYRFDAFGYRIAPTGDGVDFSRPVIVCVGESIMAGYGVEWKDSLPAQISSILKIPAANIAVNGYGSDQIYLRLRHELPRFKRPTAVVLLFTPMLFRRNLDDDRPHLRPGLVWHPPVKRWRLDALTRRLVPLRSETEIRQGVIVTREVLRASVALAHARGAAAVIVVPQFLPETPAERLVREQVLGGIDVPYVRVPLDPRWRVPGDWHPDARAARAMASAVARFLSRTDQSFSHSSRP